MSDNNIKSIYMKHGENGKIPCCCESTSCAYGTTLCAASEWDKKKNIYPYNIQNIKSKRDLANKPSKSK
ncbi:hypothetical protein CMT69_01560 [Elizabethkingia anophelis]|nr:hypothetical protein [Elizabethkingia anophelis]